MAVCHLAAGGSPGCSQRQLNTLNHVANPGQVNEHAAYSYTWIGLDDRRALDTTLTARLQDVMTGL